MIHSECIGRYGGRKVKIIIQRSHEEGRGKLRDMMRGKEGEVEREKYER